LCATYRNHPDLLSSPTRRSSDLLALADHDKLELQHLPHQVQIVLDAHGREADDGSGTHVAVPKIVAPSRREAPDRATLEHLLRRSEEHTSELQSRENLVCRLLLE